MWRLGPRPIFATISTYKGIHKVHLRYFKLSENGKWLPSKNGVALNYDEWENFKSLINSIDLEYRRIVSQRIETIPVFDMSHIQQGNVQAFPSISKEES